MMTRRPPTLPGESAPPPLHVQTPSTAEDQAAALGAEYLSPRQFESRHIRRTGKTIAQAPFGSYEG